MKTNKPLFEQKLLLQIISIVSAIILWFAITYSENPSVAIPISNINISFPGEKNLEKNGLIFVNREKLPNIAIEVRGRRSEVQSILNSVSAKVDLSDITEAGEYTRDVSYEVPNSSVMISKKKTTSVTVVIEKAVSKEVPVKILQTGADRNKEFLVKSTTPTKTVKISGTADDVSKIDAAVVSVDVSEMRKDIRGEYPIAYADEDNNIVSPSNHISHSIQTIAVNNEIYNRRTVQIELSPEYNQNNYRINVKSFSTDKLEVGVREDTQEIEAIYARFKDETDIKPDGKYEMTLDIPDDIYCPQPPKELIMTASIENILTKEIPVKIEYTNALPGAVVTISPDTLNVSATGTEESLRQLKAIVDLSGLDKGTYTLSATFDGDALVSGDYSVSVIIE